MELEDENWRLCSTTLLRGGDFREVKNLQKTGVPALQKDIQRETHTHTDIDTHTQRPTHCLNTLDLTLHTEHLTHNSHSNFTRDEKCFRATRRLVSISILYIYIYIYYLQVVPGQAGGGSFL